MKDHNNEKIWMDWPKFCGKMSDKQGVTGKLVVTFWKA
jgi:hypothetical protein